MLSDGYTWIPIGNWCLSRVTIDVLGSYPNTRFSMADETEIANKIETLLSDGVKEEKNINDVIEEQNHDSVKKKKKKKKKKKAGKTPVIYSVNISSNAWFS